MNAGYDVEAPPDSADQPRPVVRAAGRFTPKKKPALVRLAADSSARATLAHAREVAPIGGATVVRREKAGWTRPLDPPSLWWRVEPRDWCAPAPLLEPIAHDPSAVQVGRRRIRVIERFRRRHRRGLFCVHCLRVLSPEAVTVEHLVPAAHGGTNALRNLTVACSPCNNARGDGVATLLVEP